MTKILEIWLHSSPKSSTDEFEEEPSTFAHFQRKISGRRPKAPIKGRSLNCGKRPSPKLLLNPNHNLVKEDEVGGPIVGLQSDGYKSESKRRSCSAHEFFPLSGKRKTWKKGCRIKKTRRVTISESATKTILDESQVVSYYHIQRPVRLMRLRVIIWSFLSIQ